MSFDQYILVLRKQLWYQEWNGEKYVWKYVWVMREFVLPFVPFEGLTLYCGSHTGYIKIGGRVILNDYCGERTVGVIWSPEHPDKFDAYVPPSYFEYNESIIDWCIEEGWRVYEEDERNKNLWKVCDQIVERA